MGIHYNDTANPSKARRQPGRIPCPPASIPWEVGNAATAGVKQRRLTPDRARQLVRDFEHVTMRELAVDLQRAIDLALKLGLYAYDACMLDAARSLGYPLLALDATVKKSGRKIGLRLVGLER